MIVVKALQALKAKDDGSFYNTEREMNQLIDLVKARIHEIVLLLGPSDSGKSTILKRLEVLFKEDRVLREAFPVFRVDTRLFCHTPQLVATAILRKLKSWSHWLKGALKAQFAKYLDISEFAEYLELVPDGDLAAVIASLGRLLAYESADWRPVIIIDQADNLKMWESTYTKMLLEAMTKSATVILSTSDDLFKSWLEDHVNPLQWTAVGVGYLSEQDARRYFSTQVTSGFQFGDEEWKRIFKVCGGHLLELRNCAIDVCKLGKNLDDVLEDDVGMYGGLFGAVLGGVCGNLETDGWDGATYVEVMKLIVKHGAVPLGKIEPLFCGNSKAQLIAMVKNKLIHVRFMSANMIYDDVKKAAGCEDTDYIMACSPAHFVAMERYVAELTRAD